MPEKTVKRRLKDCDAALASDDGPAPLSFLLSVLGLDGDLGRRFLKPA
jgi:hypothetical protein